MVEIAHEKVLTNTELISYLLLNNEGEGMKGVIRPKGNCPVCQGKFVEVKKLGYICPVDKATPKRLFVDLFYSGKRIKIYSDKQGQPLDTYQRASNLLIHINYEIKNYSFDPSKYIKNELEKFYVTTLLDKFLISKIDKLAPSYKKDFKRYVENAKNYFTVTDVRELRKLNIINYKEHLEKNFSISEKTIRNNLDVFKTFLRYLKNDLEILDIVPAFPQVETVQPKTNWLSPEVQRRVFEIIPENDKPIIAFLMLSGCRPGEARALKCKDVNLDLGIVTISATFSMNVYREKRKGRNSKSVTIPIHPELLAYIKNRVQNNLPNAYIFVNSRTGNYYSENKLRKLWDKIREIVGLSKEIRLYDATRHSFASQLVNQGVSLINVSRLLGHSSIKMTERYAHSDVGKLRIDVSNLSLSEDRTVLNVSPIIKCKL